MFRVFTFIMLSMLTISVLASDSAEKYTKEKLVFSDYGTVVKVSDRDVPLKENFTYQVVFDITKSAAETNQLNHRINSVARFINMHAINGVDLERMQIAVVLHGSATRDGLTHEAYKERYQMNNPTLDLIEQLNAKGVKFYQCGQSAYFQQVAKKELATPVALALSAMTILTELQAAGYQRLP